MRSRKLLDLAPRRVTVVDPDGTERDVDIDERRGR